MVGSSIWLYGVTRKDSGLYTCHGDNQWNYVANDTVYLEVSFILQILDAKQIYNKYCVLLNVAVSVFCNSTQSFTITFLIRCLNKFGTLMNFYWLVY